MKRTTAAKATMALASVLALLTLIFLYVTYLTDSGAVGATGPIATGIFVFLIALIFALSRQLRKAARTPTERLRDLRRVLLATMLLLVGSIAWLVLFLFGEVPDAEVKNGTVIGIVAILLTAGAVTAVVRIGGPNAFAAAPESEPAWWIRDIIVATCLGTMFLSVQLIFDEQRSGREHAIAADAARDNERRDNLRFIRERSGSEAIPRPFFGFDLSFAHLQGLSLVGADLRDSTWRGTEVTATVLADADMRGSSISYSSFRTSSLTGSDFGCLPEELNRFGLLTCTAISDSSFGAVDLTGASFAGASLMSVAIDPSSTLANTDFRDAFLSDVLLDGVNLSEALLDNSTNLVDVCFDANTRWPPGFNRPFRSGKECRTF